MSFSDCLHLHQNLKLHVCRGNMMQPATSRQCGEALPPDNVFRKPTKRFLSSNTSTGVYIIFSVFYFLLFTHSPYILFSLYLLIHRLLLLIWNKRCANWSHFPITFMPRQVIKSFFCVQTTLKLLKIKYLNNRHFNVTSS